MFYKRVGKFVNNVIFFKWNVIIKLLLVKFFSDCDKCVERYKYVNFFFGYYKD